MVEYGHNDLLDLLVVVNVCCYTDYVPLESTMLYLGTSDIHEIAAKDFSQLESNARNCYCHYKGVLPL